MEPGPRMVHEQLFLHKAQRGLRDRFAAVVFQCDAADMAEEEVGERTGQQAVLLGPSAVAAGAVGVEVELPAIDPVLHVASRKGGRDFP